MVLIWCVLLIITRVSSIERGSLPQLPFPKQMQIEPISECTWMESNHIGSNSQNQSPPKLRNTHIEEQLKFEEIACIRRIIQVIIIVFLCAIHNT